MAARTFDVVVFGATGFTGRLVARYLAQRDPEPGLAWAIAGRSAAKLAEVAEELGIDVPQIVADSHDRASLDALAAQTRVVCTTVGPYAKYGAELVAACVAAGTHYVDLTGEVQFIRRMIDLHHQAARDAATRIVHCCGFDSIPSDLGVFNLQQAALDRFGAPFERVECVVWGVRGGFSGGTVASLIQMLEEAGDPSVRRVLGDPYSLADDWRGPDRREQRGPRFSEAAQTWTAPFLMAAVNERMVRRSNVLLDKRYGTDFRYGESMRMGSGLRGRLSAMAFTAGAAGAVGALAIGPVRALAARTVLPAPGEGPDEASIRSGFFRYRLFGHRAGGDPANTLVLRVDGQGDPGYGATSCMLAESAICLARNPDLPRSGVLTPASAMGRELTVRLNATDVQFALE